MGTTTKYTLGSIPDQRDDRDYPIAKFLAKAIELPQMIDLSSTCLPPRNQGDEPVCVSMSACGAKESEERNKYLSVRFMHDRIGLLSGGAYPRDAMKVLAEIGVPPETCQSFRPNEKTYPCAKALDLAKENKIKGYARLTSLSEMKQCLYEWGCFTISVGITDAWFNVGSTGRIEQWGEIIGYHQVVFVGYDDATKLVKFRNSWGGEWGESGYGYIEYDYLMRMLSDAWSFIDVPESEEEKPTPTPTPAPKPTMISSLFAWISKIFSRKKVPA